MFPFYYPNCLLLHFILKTVTAPAAIVILTLRGFEQQRLSVMVNGVPQNDPEDFSVYWIDFPDLLGSTTNIQVQRGAGSAFYGPPAIGGSVNLLAVPFQPKPSVTI